MGHTLAIEEKKNAPKVNFNLDTGECSVLGRSFPENAKKFYDPIYEWLENSLPETEAAITLDLYFYYLSSSSVIAVLDLIKIFDRHSQTGKSLTINWRFDEDDDDVKRIGEDYCRIIKSDINILEEK